MAKSFEQGFTLLELLIVIAIIGLLASVVMVQYPEAQDRARIAQAWSFSDGLRGALQMDMAGWWSLDGDAKDRWTEQNHGTAYGTVVWGEGIVNNALQLNGSNTYVRVPVSSALTSAALGYTVEVWVKPQVDGDYWTGVVGKPGRNYNFWLGSSNSPAGGFVHHRFHTTSGTNDSCPDTLVGSIPMDQWTHVVLTNNGSKCRTYINGKVLSERTFSATMVSNSSDLFIGRNLDGNNSNYFKGKIDEVRIYNEALPMTVIQQHYAAGLKEHNSLAVK